MKKIATITFHWAKNYGAVLQAFALQKCLKNNGFETEIINYLPLRTILLQLLNAIKKMDFVFLKKIVTFKKFRKTELLLSAKRYYSNMALSKCSKEYDAVITGSDQVWNMSFTHHGEGRLTLSYYLNFCQSNTKRISYAVSFGATKIDDRVLDAVRTELQKFDSVSVREISATQMLNEIGISSLAVADPTLLLKEEDYLPLINKAKSNEKFGVLTYIIHSNQTMAHQVNDYIINKSFNFKKKNIVIKDCNIYNWLYSIKNSEFIVTNSFHGTVFSLIFHKPFVVVAVPNSGMNDRLITLLNKVDLSNRFIEKYDTTVIDAVFNDIIDWKTVDCRINSFRKESMLFLLEALK